MTVAFTFDFDADEVWIADDSANADRPGVLSQGTYGAKVGVRLILELLARQEVSATFFVPGRVAERYPERVDAISPPATRDPGTEIVELPVQWILDDAAHFWFSGADWNRKIATVSEVREIWTGELSGIVELGGSCIITMHAQVIGRPHRIAFLEQFIAEVRSRRDVWIATCAQTAATLP